MGGGGGRQMAFSGPPKVTNAPALLGEAAVTGFALGKTFSELSALLNPFEKFYHFNGVLHLREGKCCLRGLCLSPFVVGVLFNTMHLTDPWTLGLTGRLIQIPNISI